MTTDATTSRIHITRSHCYLLLTAAVMTYLVITMGAIVCVTESGMGCPDWPWCYGRLIPPLRMDSIIEYTHRAVAWLTSLSILAAAVVGWRKSRAMSRTIRWISWPPAIAVPLLLAVSVFGALAVLRGLSPGAAALDLGSALTVQVLMVTATVVAFARHDEPDLPDRLSFRSSFAKLALATLVAVFVVLVSGVLVAESGSMVRCLGWPLYDGRLAPVDLRGWLEVARRWIAGGVGVLVVALVVQAWRTQRERAGIQRGAWALAIAFLVEAAVGALLVTQGLTVFLLVTYVAAAAAVWALLIALTVSAGLVSSTLPEGSQNG